ncbi:RrF2 family transcriptional regulator [Paenibacillus methanolicus]|uniref:Rrf2 family protein n=1 Tax=Paenibacillus methanolicus TaxID=582686 RepID=A0A5S5C660_9BACL|nr:Rrf2 family transcriptional regulator [Paenibacillus methanolicus]TYP74905.1 Rrf2 family protein [Paenibacillus methanolicus]
MKTNRTYQIEPPKFRKAVHILIYLAKDGAFQSSATIACSVQSHATFLRRILALLANAGIVETREGREGGYGLKTSPDRISLAEVYMAVRGEEHDCAAAEAACEQTEMLDSAMDEIMLEADKRMQEFLQGYTLADLMETLTPK